MKKGKGIETLYRIVFASIAALAMLFSVCNAFSFTYDTKVVIPGVVLFALIIGIGGEKQRRYMPFFSVCLGNCFCGGLEEPDIWKVYGSYSVRHFFSFKHILQKEGMPKSSGVPIKHGDCWRLE